MNKPTRPIPSERRELFAAATRAECEAWEGYDCARHEIEYDDATRMHSVYRARRVFCPEIKTPIRRLTRATFKVQGVSQDHHRPLWVSLEPGDLVSFCPKGTKQRVTVPIASLYNFARFAAARSTINAKSKKKHRQHARR